jgi:glycosyltransferase involved in cell wall biosynthesis
MAFHEISLVIKSLQEDAHPRETVESAMNETASNVEVVLVDNNADPKTRDIAMDFASRFPESVRYVHEPMQGVAALKNRRLFESRGRFVVIFDGDNLMAPEHLRLQREAFLDNLGTAAREHLVEPGFDGQHDGCPHGCGPNRTHNLV